MTRVQDVMVTQVASCHVETPLTEACRLMWKRGCGILPVTETATEQVLGILTDRDIAMAVCRLERSPAAITAGEAMNETVHGVEADSEVARAHGLMREHRVRRLPVTTGHGALAGIVSLDDLARRATHGDDDAERAAVADTLAAICRT